MKKIIILILVVIMTTGCTAVRIDTKSIDNILGVVLQKNNTLYNQVGKGYKYYVPRGVKYIDTTDYNDKLYSNGNYYYLYIDIVSYYYKKELEHTLKEDIYYSCEIEVNGKKGYIEIEEINEKYLIVMQYNYSLFEALVSKNDINDTVLNATYMLSTMKINDNIIKLALDGKSSNLEKEYTKFKQVKQTDGFLKLAGDEIKE